MNDVSPPLVSVVMPTFNHAHYLGRALQSVLDQTYTNWELIVIDNHSLDHTDEIVNGFSDPRITYLKIHNNGVIAISRNAGIKASKGEWIAFLDSDDWWANEKLQVCIENTYKNVDLIYHNIEIVDSKTPSLQAAIIKGRQLCCPVIIDLLKQGNALANSSVVVRKTMIEKIGGIDENPKMVGCEDYNTWLRIGQISENFLFIPQTLGFYFFHENNLSHRDMRIPWEFAIFDFKKRLTINELSKIRAQFRYGTGRRAYLNKDYKKAYHFLRRSFFYLNNKLKVKCIYMFLIMLINYLCKINEKK